MMFAKSVSLRITIFFILACLGSQVVSAQTTEFTYQGSLNVSGMQANGSFDFEFVLFDALSGGVQIGSTNSRNGVAVANGIFAVNLDFGNQFPGANRFMEIRTRTAGGGAFTTLLPRQPMKSAPYAVKSLTAENSAQLGGIAANQYLQTNGNGSGLTNLNAGNVTTGTLANARLGQIPTANIADSAVTSQKVATGQVVKSVNTLKDDVTLAAGTNITITPAGNTLTIASTSGGVGGSGTTNSIPFWSGGTTLGNSQITQNVNGVQLPNTVQLAAGAQGYQMSFGSPNGETGISMAGASGRADVRFDGTTLKLLAGPAGASPTNGLFVNTTGGATVTGINSDGAVLTARRSGGDPFIIIDSTSASQNSVLAFRKGNFNRWLLYTDASPESGGNLGSDFKLDAYNNAGGIGTFLFVKRSTGFVGIGTTNPVAKLHAETPLANTAAVYGKATGSGGVGVYGQSSLGPAVHAEGNATQARDKGGFAKAMILVNANGTIARCYNGITNSSTGNCGFAIAQPATGFYDINFGFKVDDRFISITPTSLPPQASCIGGSAVLAELTGNVATISTWCVSYANNPFMIFVY